MNHHKQETLNEVAKMTRGGMQQISSRELENRLDTLGYKINKTGSFCYLNNLNEDSYNAKSVCIICKETGKGFANIAAKKERLKELQEIRRECFVFENGKIWEL